MIARTGIDLASVAIVLRLSDETFSALRYVDLKLGMVRLTGLPWTARLQDLLRRAMTETLGHR